MRALLPWIHHRGPDEESIYVHGGFGIAVARLSIRGGDAGRQPVISDDGQVVLAFNGELFDKVPKGESDTRWLLEDYLRNAAEPAIQDGGLAWEWLSLLLPLRGAMGCVVVFDRARQRLRIVQGRPTIKPVHLGTDAQGALWFASELTPLLAAVPEWRALDASRAGALANVHFVAEGPYAGLDPATGGALGEWELDGEGFRMPAPSSTQVVRWGDSLGWEAAETPSLREAWRSAARMAADVEGPVSLFLSGGLDSSGVAALCGRDDVLALTGRFAPHGGALDESAEAAAVAKHCGLRHEIIDLRDEDLLADLPDVIRALEMPTAGPGSLSTWRLAKRAAEHGKVVLTGTGGDELFGGYARLALLAGRSGAWTAGYEPLQKRIEDAGEDPTRRFLAAYSRWSDLEPYLDRDFAGGLGSVPEAGFVAPHGEGHVLGRALWHERRITLPTLLHVEDRILMRHGLEGRPVLCLGDLPRLAEAWDPERLIGPDGEGKRPLRLALEGLIPEHVRMNKHKRGFPTPFARAARGAGRDRAEAILGDRRFRERGWWNVEACRALLDAERPVHDRAIWMVLAWEVWARLFLDGDAFADTQEEPNPA
jgi:asparagine synthase (glutamine-hydrolysing)